MDFVHTNCLPPATTDSIVAIIPASLSALVEALRETLFFRETTCCSIVKAFILCNPTSDKQTPST